MHAIFFFMGAGQQTYVQVYPKDVCGSWDDSVEDFHFGHGVIPCGLVQVHPDVVEDVPAEFQELEDHDDGNAGEQAEGSSKSRDEAASLWNSYSCTALQRNLQVQHYTLA